MNRFHRSLKATKGNFDSLVFLHNMAEKRIQFAQFVLKVRHCEVADGQVLDDVAVPGGGAGLLHRVVVSLEAECHLEEIKRVQDGRLHT